MAASLAAPDLTGFPQPPGAFTSRLPAGRSPFPPLDMTTTATGLLCWRDFPAGMAASLAAPDDPGYSAAVAKLLQSATPIPGEDDQGPGPSQKSAAFREDFAI